MGKFDFEGEDEMTSKTSNGWDTSDSSIAGLTFS